MQFHVDNSSEYSELSFWRDEWTFLNIATASEAYFCVNLVWSKPVVLEIRFNTETGEFNDLVVLDEPKRVESIIIPIKSCAGKIKYDGKVYEDGLRIEYAEGLVYARNKERWTFSMGGADISKCLSVLNGGLEWHLGGGKILGFTIYKEPKFILSAHPSNR